MNIEKVKEIKKVLEEGQFNTIKHHQHKGNPILISFADILTLINEFESENERLSKEKEDLRLFDIALGNGKVDMTLGGNTAKSFINAIVQIFEQNNATNFLATTIETISSGNKYSLVIQKENGQTPSEKLTELKDQIVELKKEIEENAFYSKGYAQGIKNTYEVVVPDKLRQFAERLKEQAYDSFGDKVIWYNDIDETLKERINETRNNEK